MWIPLLQSTPFPCPTLPLSPCPLLCAYYNTIFFRPSIILCVHENRVCSFFLFCFLLFLVLFFQHFHCTFLQPNKFFDKQLTEIDKRTSNGPANVWRAHTRQTETETERWRWRWREGPQLTVCLSLQLIDRSQSQSQSRQSDRKQNRLPCLPACLPHVKDDSSCEKVNIQTRPFSHAESQSVPLSHCPSACRVSFVVQSYCQT